MSSSQQTDSRMLRVAIADIETEPQIRATLEADRIKRVASSMKDLGQLVPIWLHRRPDGKLVVRDGHYRLAGAIELGWTEILGVIEESPMAEVDVTSVQLATQCRFDLNPMERARAYDKQLREAGMTAARLASIAGASEASISRTRALMDIRPELQELVASGALGPSLALLLDQINDPKNYARLLHRARAGKLTRGSLERELRAQSRAEPPSRKQKKASQRVIPLGKGCTLTLGARLRTAGEAIDLLTAFLEAARAGRVANGDEINSLSRIGKVRVPS